MDPHETGLALTSIVVLVLTGKRMYDEGKSYHSWV